MTRSSVALAIYVARAGKLVSESELLFTGRGGGDGLVQSS